MKVERSKEENLGFRPFSVVLSFHTRDEVLKWYAAMGAANDQTTPGSNRLFQVLTEALNENPDQA